MDLKRHRQERLSRRRELYRLCKAGEKGYQMSSAPASQNSSPNCMVIMVYVM